MKKMLFTTVLALAIILSMVTGASATESEQAPKEQQNHSHNWQCAWSDDYWHCMVCSDCHEERTITHSNNSAGICTICGHTPHEHIWQYDNGVIYDYRHGLRCTQCATISFENHIYGNDGKCTVCGNPPPHVHQWEWDGNKSTYYQIHYVVCSCGATTGKEHQWAWDGITRTDRSHRLVCEVCGYALSFGHGFHPTIFNGERCTVCGYQVQNAQWQENKPSETTPVETRPAETVPKETTPVETRPAENQPKETEPSETKPEETKPAEIEPEETIPKNAAIEGLQRSSSVWIWVATVLVVAGGLGTVVFFVKKKLS